MGTDPVSVSMGTDLNAGDVSFGDRPFVFGDRPYKMSVFFGDRPCEEAFFSKGTDPAKCLLKSWGQTLRNTVFSMGTGPSEVATANNFRESC